MIRYFAGHRTAANILMLAFLALGLVALPELRRETFPRIQPKSVQVQIVYPGASPEEIDTGICRPLEDAVAGIENLHETVCEARESIAILTVEMEQGHDLDTFYDDVETEVAAIDTFPELAEDPVISKLGRVDFVASVAVTAGEDRVELKALAEELKDRMLRRPGIPMVEIAGFSDRQIRIEVREATARALGMTLDGIAAAVARQNVDLPAGEIVSEGETTLIRFSDERRALDAYRDIPVRASGPGGVVTLGDIADITARFEEDEVKTLLNGEPAALLDITKSTTDDTLRVMEEVEAFLAETRPTLPDTVGLEVVRDISGILKDRLSMLVENALQGLVLVFGVVWLFFGPRQAFWIAMGLPVSFLGAIALMQVTGNSINMLTLVGLLIVIGILMDDAIVIAENIAQKREEGMGPLEGAIAGAREVAPGVLSSYVTTVVIFGSLAFLRGDIGEVLRVVPIVMAMVLTVSLVEAFCILPHHLAHGAARDRASRVNLWIDRRVDAARERIVRPVARAAVRWRYLTLGIAVFLLLSSAALVTGGLVKFNAFPDVEGDRVEARIELAASATLGQTEAMVAEVLAALERTDAALSGRNPDGAALVEDVIVRYSQNPDAGTTGQHLATVDVDLLESARRGVRMAEIIARWKSEIPETARAERITVKEPALGPGGRDIALRLKGDDLDMLAEASRELRDWLEGYEGTLNITDDLTAGKPELDVSLKPEAATLGLDARMIADQLRSAFQGRIADEIQIGAETVEIDVRAAAADRDSLAALDNFTVETPAGERVPLSAVAAIEAGRGFTRITRVNRQPTVTVTGDVDPVRANAAEIVAETLAKAVPRLEERFPGLAVGVEGQEAEARETQASMLRGVGLGLIAVFLLLSFQLRSYAEPLVIMAIIPFALIGAIWGHLALGLDLTLPSMLGLVSLAGIVVNDSILLVNVIKRGHDEEGLSIAESAPEGAVARFRAILLTSLTTIAGVVPLLFETSLQAQFLIPLVASIAFGLLATTLLIIFVIPAFYTVLDDLHLTERAARKGDALPEGRTARP
jgi:multidrug efflux pump subunit AcrB